REIVSRIFLSPATVCTILRIVVVAFSIPVSSITTASLELLSPTAIPLALFSVGIAMHPALASLRSGMLSLGMVMAGIGLKNIIFPLVTLGLAWIFRDAMRPGWFGTVFLMATMPMSTSGYILSERYDGSAHLSAAVLAGTTRLSILTVPILVSVVL